MPYEIANLHFGLRESMEEINYLINESNKSEIPNVTYIEVPLNQDRLETSCYSPDHDNGCHKTRHRFQKSKECSRAMSYQMPDIT